MDDLPIFTFRSTSDGVRFLKGFLREDLKQVKSWRKNGPNTLPETVEIIFKADIGIQIEDTFATGYQGTGPRGLYDLLVGWGIEKEQAELVFKDQAVKVWTFD